MKLVYPLRSHAAHIVLVLHDFSSGGSERVAIRLANQWARSGRKVTILCGTTDGPARALVDPMVAVVSVWPQIRRSWMSRLALGSAFADCIALLRPEVVFAPGNFHIPIIGTIARMLGPDRPVLVCKLSNPLRRPGRLAPIQGLFEAVTRRITAPIDALVAMSASLADEARGILRRPSVPYIHEPNIDTRQDAPMRRTPSQNPTIVCAGRLVRQKNFALAIEAFARLDRRLCARLLILGEGDQRLRLETLVERLGLNDRVEFAGFVPDVRPKLAQASLFLLTSRYEGYPAVLIEALCAGLPVVTTDCSPAMGEIMSDPAFGRVVPDSPDAIAGAMTAILACDPVTVNAAQLAERHRLDLVMQDYLGLFDRLVEARLGVKPLEASQS